MKKHVVILGAGFAGLELAARLSDSLADEVRVTLLDENEAFGFGFSKLDVLLGRRATTDVLLQYRDISKPRVDFRQERVTAIDPQTRRVATDQSSTTPSCSSSPWGRTTTTRPRRGSRRAASSTTRSPARSDCAMSCPTSMRAGS